MNKKILTLALITLVLTVFTMGCTDNTTTDNTQPSEIRPADTADQPAGTTENSDTIVEEDIAPTIEDEWVSEDEEVEIGDMY